MHRDQILQLAREHRADFAEAAGITTTYTSDLERGTKVPSLTIILRISRALRISTADLLRDFSIEAVRRMRLD